MDYIEAFRNLKNNQKYSRKSPEKAILLLTIIEMYETNVLSENEIKYDETLKDVFSKVWNRCLPNEAMFAPSVFIPFWYMQSEDFWHIVPRAGKNDIIYLMLDDGIKPSERRLIDGVHHAELDADLFFLITMPSGRRSLKRALLEEYTSLSAKIIDKLSESSDTSIDYSVSAMSEYKKILDSEVDRSPNSIPGINNNLPEHLSELEEDLQLALNICYFTFLKEHRYEREILRDYCPTVDALYDKIVGQSFKREELPPSFIPTIENFMRNLKFSLMSEDGSFDLIEYIDIAIDDLNCSPIENLSDKVENVPNMVLGETYDSLSEKDGQGIDIEEEPKSSTNVGLNDKPWENIDERLLAIYFKNEYSIDKIASSLGRTQDSVKAKLSSLGLIDSQSQRRENITEESNKKVDSPLPEIEGKLDFFVENVRSNCYILNKSGEISFTTSGHFKIFHGRVYRLNYKTKVFTVKNMIRSGETWKKGDKVIVATANSDLFQDLTPYECYDEIEDIVEFPQMRYNKIKVKGVLYNSVGKKITINQTELFNGDKSNQEGVTASDIKSKENSPKEEKPEPQLTELEKDILRVLKAATAPLTPGQIAISIDYKLWEDKLDVELVDSILKTLPGVEYIQWGKYQLKK